MTALVANAAGEIFELDGYAALGMEGPTYTPLRTSNTRNMPYGSELMYLPDRKPILFNMRSSKIETLSQNPYAPGEPLFPVTAFNSPGTSFHIWVPMLKIKKRNRCPFFHMERWGGIGENFDQPLCVWIAKSVRTCG